MKLFSNMRIKVSDLNIGDRRLDRRDAAIAADLRAGMWVPRLKLTRPTAQPNGEKRFRPVVTTPLCRSQFEARNRKRQAQR